MPKFKIIYIEVSYYTMIHYSMLLVLLRICQFVKKRAFSGRNLKKD